jgi:drug/metabolite transporter (DMT)-like permease
VSAPSGAAPALVSAALFGASTPLAKVLLDGIDPLLLAGLLYLGSGIGLSIVQVMGRFRRRSALVEAPLRGRQWLWLGLAIVAGGVAAPGLLMSGSPTSAAAARCSSISALFTVVSRLARFGEAIGARIALGMTYIGAGALVLSWQSGRVGIRGPRAIARPASHGPSNNLRERSLTDPVRIIRSKTVMA